MFRIVVILVIGKKIIGIVAMKEIIIVLISLLSSEVEVMLMLVGRIVRKFSKKSGREAIGSGVDSSLIGKVEVSELVRNVKVDDLKVKESFLKDYKEGLDRSYEMETRLIRNNLESVNESNWKEVLTGLFESDGSYDKESNSIRIGLRMNNKELLFRFLEVLGVGIVGRYFQNKKVGSEVKYGLMYYWLLTGKGSSKMLSALKEVKLVGMTKVSLEWMRLEGMVMKGDELPTMEHIAGIYVGDGSLVLVTLKEDKFKVDIVIKLKDCEENKLALDKVARSLGIDTSYVKSDGRSMRFRITKNELRRIFAEKVGDKLIGVRYQEFAILKEILSTVGIKKDRRLKSTIIDYAGKKKLIDEIRIKEYEVNKILKLIEGNIVDDVGTGRITFEQSSEVMKKFLVWKRPDIFEVKDM